MKRAWILGVLSVASAFAQTTPMAFVPSDELNKELPRWMKFSGEFRGRFEGFAGGSFQANNEDAYYLNRFRLNLRIQPVSWLKFYVQGQDARVFGKNQQPPTPPFQDTMDIRLAYVEIGEPEKKTFGMRVGRQELAFGDQRLIGHLNWANTARTFDAVRVTLRSGGGYRLDAFASSVVNARDYELNHHQQGNNLHGLYGGIERLVPNAVVEPYVLWRVAPRQTTELKTLGSLDQKTGGVRWVGKLPRHFDYNVEMAMQRGMLGTDTLRAWAGHWMAGYTFAQSRYKPHAVLEFNYASGDGDAKDSRRGTFDQLYPTGHDKYRLTDQVGWRNVEHVRAGVEWKPAAKWQLLTFYHNYWLADAHDGLYAANSALLVRVAAGTAGRHVGQEIDQQAIYNWSKSVQVAGGIGHLFTGEFLNKSTPGKGYTFPYVSVNYVF